MRLGFRFSCRKVHQFRATFEKGTSRVYHHVQNADARAWKNQRGRPTHYCRSNSPIGFSEATCARQILRKDKMLLLNPKEKLVHSPCYLFSSLLPSICPVYIWLKCMERTSRQAAKDAFPKMRYSFSISCKPTPVRILFSEEEGKIKIKIESNKLNVLQAQSARRIH